VGQERTPDWITKDKEGKDTIGKHKSVTWQIGKARRGKMRTKGRGNQFREEGLIKMKTKKIIPLQKQVLLTSSSSLVHLFSM
jgi:hypothetical protein